MTITVADKQNVEMKEPASAKRKWKLQLDKKCPDAMMCPMV
ncbi:hypothetical protein SECTIM467_2 [Brevibacillus phage SecTim467]|uniref:Uncharacterized protein n=2 Tax=Jenstvirus jenst TaxID=1982225 RepID=A0A0K2CPG6_9CAUD|nr:hypothetical protein AVV11_gp002 [Brevibacillus phage Jenst]ALA07132.1 hypothetical protein JENST_2 [Brevibacillus phage Jenst]ALA07505.1 hypothetical protein SECTIM467_2 [Brevibacillus phage SecTim467]